MIKLERRPGRRKNAALILLILGNLLFSLTCWLLWQYDSICLDQVLFQIRVSASGVQRSLAGSAVLRVGGMVCLATLLELVIYQILAGKRLAFLRGRRYRAYSQSGAAAFFKRAPVALSSVVLAASGMFMTAQLNIVPYYRIVSTESDFIEEHYADPAQTTLTFPEKKRNLVYIYLESMESTFSDTVRVSSLEEDYIAPLTALAQEHVSFSNTEGIGGALSFSGTTWTAAAMVSQTSGVPMKMPLSIQPYGEQEDFIPGAVSLGEILAEAGYSQTLLVGSDAEFHGREKYFRQHGGYQILDVDSLKEAGRLPEDYREWWGFEDEKLFAFAREELTRLAAREQPFNLTLLTADTHFPDGYRCRLCEEAHATQYADVLSCSARQVYDFVAWIKAQPFYENTTIILCGDHLTMDAAFLAELDEDYVRTIYNCVINAPVTAAGTKNRQFATFDLYPTTLAALGVRIKGERLGLGTNLFSDTPTLTELYGFEALDQELQKESAFFSEHLLQEVSP